MVHPLHFMQNVVVKIPSVRLGPKTVTVLRLLYLTFVPEIKLAGHNKKSLPIVF